MKLIKYTQTNGDVIQIPENFRLSIEETSAGVYRVDLVDNEGRNVTRRGGDLDEMVTRVISDLKEIRGDEPR